MRYISDSQQIEVVDRTIVQGWMVVRVETRPGGDCAVTFAKVLGASRFMNREGVETRLERWHCGYAAARHAREIMSARV